MTSDNGGVPAAVIEALVFAGEVHNGQRRKDSAGSPHLKHVLQVTGLLVNAGLRDETLLTAAALHDVLRDTETTSAELRQRFGDQVASVVEELSADSVLSRMDRREELPGRVAGFGRDAQLIKMAEKISNLSDLVENAPVGWSRQRRREYFDWVGGVTRSLRARNEVLTRLLDEALAMRP